MLSRWNLKVMAIESAILRRRLRILNSLSNIVLIGLLAFNFIGYSVRASIPNSVIIVWAILLLWIGLEVAKILIVNIRLKKQQTDGNIVLERFLALINEYDRGSRRPILFSIVCFLATVVFAVIVGMTYDFSTVVAIVFLVLVVVMIVLMVVTMVREELRWTNIDKTNENYVIIGDRQAQLNDNATKQQSNGKSKKTLFMTVGNERRLAYMFPTKSLGIRYNRLTLSFIISSIIVGVVFFSLFFIKLTQLEGDALLLIILIGFWSMFLIMMVVGNVFAHLQRNLIKMSISDMKQQGTRYLANIEYAEKMILIGKEHNCKSSIRLGAIFLISAGLGVSAYFLRAFPISELLIGLSMVAIFVLFEISLIISLVQAKKSNAIFVPLEEKIKLQDKQFHLDNQDNETQLK